MSSPNLYKTASCRILWVSVSFWDLCTLYRTQTSTAAQKSSCRCSPDHCTGPSSPGSENSSHAGWSDWGRLSSWVTQRKLLLSQLRSLVSPQCCRADVVWKVLCSFGIFHLKNWTNENQPENCDRLLTSLLLFFWTYQEKVCELVWWNRLFEFISKLFAWVLYPALLSNSLDFLIWAHEAFCMIL